MSYKKELETAKIAAKEAAEVVRKFAGNGAFNVELKAKNDLVTDADVASENKVLEVIAREFPDDQILAEENHQLDELPEGRVWIIDPIDGTTNFAHGFPVFCISIAFWENKKPRMGLILEVVHNELFTAIEGEGAYRNGKRIEVSETTEPANSLIGTGFPYNNLNLVDSFLKFLHVMMKKTHGVRRPGSAAWDLCNVACGRYEGFYEYGLSPWDVAAGVLIIREAGGVISDWKGGNDWLFGQRIIAGNKPIHKFLKEEIRSCFKADELAIQ